MDEKWKKGVECRDGKLLAEKKKKIVRVQNIWLIPISLFRGT